MACVKSVRIQSYSGPYFPAFGLKKERYRVFLRILSERGKKRTGIAPNIDTPYAMMVCIMPIIKFRKNFKSSWNSKPVPRLLSKIKFWLKVV